ncbi:hypothetical protein M2J80_12835 [Pseudomonas sp. NY11382]|nr:MULTISPECIES: hypothetical protein [Pseudomonas]WBM35290.1 hypothetical protein M2J80_12835 [Pseudomonas sp. NY11382]
MIHSDDLRLSNLRIGRHEAPHGTDQSALGLLEHAMQQLFEEQVENLHEQVQRTLLGAAYRFCHHNQVHTAELLGLSRNVTRTLLLNLGELKVNKRRSAQAQPCERVLHLSI